MPCCYYTGINEKGVQAELMESLEDEPETIIRLRDVGCDNIATDKNAFAGAGSHLKTYVKHVTMAKTGPPLTTHILDTSRGVPAANVPIVLSIQGTDGGFTELEKNCTNNDGRTGFLQGGNWQPGVYRLHFDTDAYFKAQNTEGFYPYVEVVFKIVDVYQHYHVPLLLNPYGYSTYRGS